MKFKSCKLDDSDKINKYNSEINLKPFLIHFIIYYPISSFMFL